MRNLEQRLTVIERRLATAQRTNLVLVMVVGAFICAAANPQQSQQAATDSHREPADAPQTIPQIVSAQQFVLVDAEGRARTRLESTDRGAALVMLDSSGHKRVEISHDGENSSLRLLSSDEQPIAELRTHEDRSAELTLHGQQGSSLTRADGYHVRDTNEQTCLVMSLVNGNFAMLGVSQPNQQGPPSIELTASDADRAIKLHNSAGFPLLQVHTSTDDQVMLSLQNPANERSVRLTSTAGKDGAPSLEFFSPARADGSGGLLPRLQLGLDSGQEPYVRTIDGTGRASVIAPATAGPDAVKQP